MDVAIIMTPTYGAGRIDPQTAARHDRIVSTVEKR